MNIFKKLKTEEVVEFVIHLINFTNMHINHQYQSNSGYVKIYKNITIRKNLEKLKTDLLFSNKENIAYIYKSKLNKISKELQNSCNENVDLYKSWKVSKNIGLKNG